MKKLLLTFNFICITSCFVFGQTWDSLTSGISGSSVGALCVYNGNLYAGGAFGSAGKVTANNIASWNGTVWSSVGSGFTNGKSYASIGGLCVYNGNLYAAGQFDSAGGKPANNIAVWNGTTWSNVGLGISGGYFVETLCVFNGKLYVGGWFDSAGGQPAKNIAVWDGTNWSSTGNANKTIDAIYTNDSILYVGGDFDSIGGISAKYIAQWNGVNWNHVGSGAIGINSEVKTITKFNNLICAAGIFDTIGGKPASNIATWDGSSWSPIIPGLNYYVITLCEGNGVLNAGGEFTSAGGLSTRFIADWNGLSWNSLSTGMGMHDTGVYALTMYNGALYAGGAFNSAGGIKTNAIAEWCPGSCPAGINELSNSDAEVKVFPNPSHGVFTIQLSAESRQPSVEVYNMLGEKVYSAQYSIPNTQFSIDLSNQPAGIYLYRLLSDDGKFIASGKLIIE